MSLPDTVPTPRVSSTPGVCRTSEPPENHNININLTESVPIYLHRAQYLAHFHFPECWQFDHLGHSQFL